MSSSARIFAILGAAVFLCVQLSFIRCETSSNSAADFEELELALLEKQAQQQRNHEIIEQQGQQGYDGNSEMAALFEKYDTSDDEDETTDMSEFESEPNYDFGVGGQEEFDDQSMYRFPRALLRAGRALPRAGKRALLRAGRSSFKQQRQQTPKRARYHLRAGKRALPGAWKRGLLRAGRSAGQAAPKRKYAYRLRAGKRALPRAG